MWTALGAPLDSSGAGRGEERAPDALRAAGLPDAFGADDAGDVTSPLHDPRRDPETGVIALAALRAASAVLRTAVAEVVGRGARPLVLGGDCTVLIGALAGARAGVGRIGLWFVDGHADYHDGRTSPTGEAADMDLAIVSGDGPAGLVDVGSPDQAGPIVRPDDVVLLGHRPATVDADGAVELARVPVATSRMTAPQVAAAGPALVGTEWECALAARGPVWLHVDLDVLDEAALPAVTYPQPLGLDWPDFAALIRPFLASEALVGVSVADFNPDLDPTGAHARRVVAAFAEAGSGGSGG